MTQAPEVRPARLLAGVVIAATIAAVLLLRAKWWPYAIKVPGLAAAHEWPGKDIFGVGGVQPGDAPSWSAAVSFTRAYAEAVWRALLAALLISAALQTLVPRAWLLRVLNPAVLAFLLLVAPWEWTVTRAVMGAVVVVGGAALVARPAGGRAPVPDDDADEPPTLGRYLRTLLRMAVTLVPEYLIGQWLSGVQVRWTARCMPIRSCGRIGAS